jgi:hypothetical protein
MKWRGLVVNMFRVCDAVLQNSVLLLAFFLAYSSAIKMGGSTFLQNVGKLSPGYTEPHIPKDNATHSQRCENLRPRRIVHVLMVCIVT